MNTLIVELSDDGRTGTLRFPYLFQAEGVSFVIPEGFTTDFNTVPRGLWNIFPPWEYPEAAVVHDFLYRQPEVPLELADRVYRNIMIQNGAPRWKAWAAWSAVRTFGWSTI